MTFRRAAALLLLCVFSVLAFCPPVAAQQIKDVRIGAHAGKTRLVITVDQQVEPRHFVLRNPARYVIDFPRVSLSTSLPSAETDGRIRGLRFAQNTPTTSRFVIDLASHDLSVSPLTLPAPGGGIRLVYDIEGQATTVTTSPLPTAKPAVITPPRRPMIAIDAGHGGRDPGAIGAGGTFEKTLTLSASKMLQQQLELKGYRTMLTRRRDIFIPLRRRIELAKEAGADIFISVHADSIRRSDARGASVYTLSDKASDAEAAKLAENENRADLIGGVDLSHEDEEVFDILLDLTMRETMNRSNQLAETLVQNLGTGGIELLRRPHRSAGFAVLKSPDMPSVLLEMGFISTPGEERLLNRADYRKRLMQTVAKGIDEFAKDLQ